MTQISPALIIHWFRARKLWLVLFLLALAVQFFQLEPFFRLDRELIAQWQLWRLLTAHISHLNWPHFLLNMAGLLMVMVFFSAYRSQAYWLGALLFIAMLVSAGLLLDGRLDRYVGLSGVLHGLFIMGAWWEMKQHRYSGLMLLVLITAKLIWEQAFGALPGSEQMTGGRVAVNAHLYGALAGVAYLGLTRTFHKNALFDT